MGGNMTKKKNPKDLLKVGRHTVMTSEVLTKLEQAFSIGCSDDEACIYADISRMTLQRYQKLNPEFCARKELLKQKLVLKARTNIAHEINGGNIEVSKWYAERKKRDEFGKVDTEINFGVNIEVKDKKSKEEIEDLWND